MERFVSILCVTSCVILHVTSSLTSDVLNKQDVDRQFIVEIEREQQQFEEFIIDSQKENIGETSVRPAGCPADFVYLRSVNGCYKVVTDPLQWVMAGVRCRKLHNNAHLLIVNSAMEQRAVVDELLKWYSGCGLWTAGQRLDTAYPDEFVWKIVNPVEYPSARIEEMTYTNWKSGQPDYYQGEESCMLIARDYYQYEWNDATCRTRYCSVCEIDM